MQIVPPYPPVLSGWLGNITTMVENKEWLKALARLNALRMNIPTSIDRARVEEYHAILHMLLAASGEDFSHFRVPDSEFKPVAVGMSFATRRRPGVVSYGDDECDREFFIRQVEAVSSYIAHVTLNLRKDKKVDERVDYWSLDDGDLELLAIKHNIPPISRAGASGEHWYVDRVRIIDELVKRDTALRGGNSVPTPTNVINVGSMHGSSIQQATEGSTANVYFQANDPGVEQLLNRLAQSLDQIDLSGAARSQLVADIDTARAQISSPHPKPSIITECLHSARTILENAAGSVIASGLVLEIAKLLGD